MFLMIKLRNEVQDNEVQQSMNDEAWHMGSMLKVLIGREYVHHWQGLAVNLSDSAP